MNKLALATVIAATVTGAAYAQQTTTTGVGSPIQSQVLSAIPQTATTVTGFYKQNVYDPSHVKIGEVKDVLVDKDGKVGAFIIGVGGFLAIDQRDVGVPFNSHGGTQRSAVRHGLHYVAVDFNSVRATQRDRKRWLTVNGTKESLKSAPGYRYDKVKAIWVPA